MKLVLATPLYPPEIGGPATYAKALFEGLLKRGIEVELVKFSNVRRLPKLLRHIAYYYRVLRAAKNADAVLALDPVSVGLPAIKAAKRAGKPFIVKIVGDYAWEQGSQRFGVKQNLDEFVKTPQKSVFVRNLQKVQTRVAEAATRVIVPSQYLKKIVMAWGIPVEKIEVIYNAVELPTVVVPRERPKGFLVVSSGRPVPWKGFGALERVVERESSWHLQIATGLPHAESLGLVKAANVFVLNSHYEGLSHALLEAMALGTPVVATRVGGNAELIEDGVSGFLVPPSDDEALYRALSRVADDPAAARERAAAAKARLAGFTAEHMLAKTAGLLQSV
ncbi:hypothetical protein A3E65_00390 [Candidatus Kaiserbacteria bacterium RIFCSPHIGHO2_12_FULL_56_13]|uniref:Glycosyltransferase subfamily 4-like N-terminal domain-containing protein n=1 Tax=Candidatus Kaiserbacteria bacterium RIFCSPHIGHO2_12_FULL_56_13 TaxID=1798505 RepID=A0A1F6EDY2_9BACT|nr:MAG: hypothetical protein A3E65_00390 [Candidatus Kaiserbacteria bacterium RIFCSPHIGHO2_12_FULL_56_13]